MLEQIQLTNFLSFGPDTPGCELRPLNVLIGPNGSGKSNLVEALALLRAVPRDLPLPIRKGGGVDEWIWREDPRTPLPSARIEVLFGPGVIPAKRRQRVRYRVDFGSEAGRFVVLDERIENESGSPKPFLYFGYENGRPMLNNAKDAQRFLERADIDRTQSILSQRREPESYPEVAAVGDRLKEILIYREWSFGPMAPIRDSCGSGVRTDLLLEDFSNLPARILELKRDPELKRRLLGLLPEIAPGFSDIEVIPEGGRLQLYLTEGLRNVPAHRLSDGTLRFLALLSVLLNPGSAKLVVIEEPELGLHPDALLCIRDLLLEASSRFQLVVTTHSTQLVDALTDSPESVVVCEKLGSTTTLSRLDAEQISRWREVGSLGTLWMSGRLGGTRW